MTSTPFNVGLTEGTRVSSRVLRPPGGGHSDIFGVGPNENFRKAAGDKAVDQSKPEPTPNQNGKGDCHEPAVTPTEKVEAEVKPPSIAVPPRAEAPKRTRVPPGGFSSGLW